MNIKRIVKTFQHYSLQGLFRFLWLKIRRKELIVYGACAGCGSCCNKINLQTDKGWVRDEDEFDEVCKVYPEYKRFTIIGKDNQGFLQFSCTWVTENGICNDYKNRLSICKKFPDKSLHFCGGSLPMNCGYSLSAVRPFSQELKKQMSKNEK